MIQLKYFKIFLQLNIIDCKVAELNVSNLLN
jgi:hypothetical protein